MKKLIHDFHFLETAAILLVLAVAGCTREADISTGAKNLNDKRVLDSSPSDPLAIVLARHEGDSRLDQQIRRLQDQVRDSRTRKAALERLGWSFVAKARESFDPGYYKLAEACASALDSQAPGTPEAQLLRGHVLHNLHRFKEAEVAARALVEKRERPFDFGLLGDSLMEQGQLLEAVQAYQRMIDLRPDLHSYARGAHIRWLKGDLPGAGELIDLAVQAGNAQDTEAAAWVRTRKAFYQFNSGLLGEALMSCKRALEFEPGYPPALLLQGRILLAEGCFCESVDILQSAAKRNPLPEYQWTLIEALHAAGQTKAAQEVESQLHRTGAATDPRTYSLFLATEGRSVNEALGLAEKELGERADVFTHDALAWALAVSGNLQEAQCNMERALAEGTKDARLFFHAAMIAAWSGHSVGGRSWLEEASGRIDLLLPSEQQQLRAAIATRSAQSGYRAGLRSSHETAFIGFSTGGQ